MKFSVFLAAFCFLNGYKEIGAQYNNNPAPQPSYPPANQCPTPPCNLQPPQSYNSCPSPPCNSQPSGNFPCPTLPCNLQPPAFNPYGSYVTHAHRILVCPGDSEAKTDSSGNYLACLPTKPVCPDGSACMYNGFNYYCCTTPKEEPYPATPAPVPSYGGSPPASSPSYGPPPNPCANGGCPQPAQSYGAQPPVGPPSYGSAPANPCGSGGCSLQGGAPSVIRSPNPCGNGGCSLEGGAAPVGPPNPCGAGGCSQPAPQSAYGSQPAGPSLGCMLSGGTGPGCSQKQPNGNQVFGKPTGTCNGGTVPCGIPSIPCKGILTFRGCWPADIGIGYPPQLPLPYGQPPSNTYGLNQFSVEPSRPNSYGSTQAPPGTNGGYAVPAANHTGHHVAPILWYVNTNRSCCMVYPDNKNACPFDCPPPPKPVVNIYNGYGSGYYGYNGGNLFPMPGMPTIPPIVPPVTFPVPIPQVTTTILPPPISLQATTTVIPVTLPGQVTTTISPPTIPGQPTTTVVPLIPVATTTVAPLIAATTTVAFPPVTQVLTTIAPLFPTLVPTAPPPPQFDEDEEQIEEDLAEVTTPPPVITTGGPQKWTNEKVLIEVLKQILSGQRLKKQQVESPETGLFAR